MLSFRDQNTTQHTALLIFCLLLKLLGDQWRRDLIAQVAISKKTSPLLLVNSHLVCNQDRTGEGREVVLNFTLLDSSRKGKWYFKLHRNIYL